MNKFPPQRPPPLACGTRRAAWVMLPVLLLVVVAVLVPAGGRARLRVPALFSAAAATAAGGLEPEEPTLIEHPVDDARRYDGGPTFDSATEGVAWDPQALHSIVDCWEDAFDGEGSGREGNHTSGGAPLWLVFMGDSNLRNTFYTFAKGLLESDRVVDRATWRKYGSSSTKWYDQELEVLLKSGREMRLSFRFLWGVPYKIDMLLENPQATTRFRFDYPALDALQSAFRGFPLNASAAYTDFLDGRETKQRFVDIMNQQPTDVWIRDAIQSNLPKYRGRMPTGVVLGEGWGGFPRASQLRARLEQFRQHQATTDFVWAPIYVTGNTPGRYASYLDAVRAEAGAVRESINYTAANVDIVDFWDLARDLPHHVNTGKGDTAYHVADGGRYQRAAIQRLSRAMCAAAYRRVGRDYTGPESITRRPAAAAGNGPPPPQRLAVLPYGAFDHRRHWVLTDAGALKSVVTRYADDLPGILINQIARARPLARATKFPWLVLAGGDAMACTFRAVVRAFETSAVLREGAGEEAAMKVEVDLSAAGGGDGSGGVAPNATAHDVDVFVRIRDRRDFTGFRVSFRRLWGGLPGRVADVLEDPHAPARHSDAVRQLKAVVEDGTTDLAALYTRYSEAAAAARDLAAAALPKAATDLLNAFGAGVRPDVVVVAPTTVGEAVEAVNTTSASAAGDDAPRAIILPATGATREAAMGALRHPESGPHGTLLPGADLLYMNPAVAVVDAGVPREPGYQDMLVFPDPTRELPPTIPRGLDPTCVVWADDGHAGTPTPAEDVVYFITRAAARFVMAPLLPAASPRAPAPPAPAAGTIPPAVAPETLGGAKFDEKTEGIDWAVNDTAHDYMRCVREAYGDGTAPAGTSDDGRGRKVWLMLIGDSNVRNVFYTFVDMLKARKGVKEVRTTRMYRDRQYKWFDHDAFVEYTNGDVLRVSMRFLWGVPYKLELLMKNPTATGQWVDFLMNNVQQEFQRLSVFNDDGTGGPLSAAYKAHFENVENLNHFLYVANSAADHMEVAPDVKTFAGMQPHGIFLTEGWGAFPFAHQLQRTLAQFEALKGRTDVVYSPIHVTYHSEQRYRRYVDAVKAVRGGDGDGLAYGPVGANYQIHDNWDIAAQLPHRNAENTGIFHARVGGPYYREILQRTLGGLCALAATRRGGAAASSPSPLELWGRRPPRPPPPAPAGTPPESMITTNETRWVLRHPPSDAAFDANNLYNEITVGFVLPDTLRTLLQDWYGCWVRRAEKVHGEGAGLWVVVMGDMDMTSMFTALRHALPWALRAAPLALDVYEAGVGGLPGPRDDKDLWLRVAGRRVRISMRRIGPLGHSYDLGWEEGVHEAYQGVDDFRWIHTYESVGSMPRYHALRSKPEERARFRKQRVRVPPPEHLEAEHAAFADQRPTVMILTNNVLGYPGADVYEKLLEHAASWPETRIAYLPVFVSQKPELRYDEFDKLYERGVQRATNNFVTVDIRASAHAAKDDPDRTYRLRSYNTVDLIPPNAALMLDALTAVAKALCRLK